MHVCACEHMHVFAGLHNPCACGVCGRAHAHLVTYLLGRVRRRMHPNPNPNPNPHPHPHPHPNPNQVVVQYLVGSLPGSSPTLILPLPLHPYPCPCPYPYPNPNP